MASTPSIVLDEALRWIKRGASPIPIPHRSKAPNIAAWQQLRLTAADAPAAFNGASSNLGILWGAASNGLVDIDLDCPAAVSLAGELLPSTACYGRASAPASHMLYRCPGASTRKWAAPPQGMLVELRADGCQSVVPPSVHPSGESYTWRSEVKPATIVPGVLLRRLALVAAGAALAGSWADGARHETALALAGAMLGAGWSVQEVLDLVLALERTSPGFPELADRERAVRDTARKMSRGEPASGLPTLAALMGEALVAVLKRSEWLGLGAVVLGAGNGPNTPTQVGGGLLSASDDEVVTREASGIVGQPITWLWPHRIARGKLSMLAGKQGLSKSVLSCEIAAIVSRGDAWPFDGTRCEQGSVLLLSAEDDAGDTIWPRLKAAEADLTRVHIVDGIRRGDGPMRGMTFADVAALDRYLTAQPGKFSLLVCDPVGAFMGMADGHRDNEVRSLLAPLKELAERHMIAVLLIAHLNKATGLEALYRVVGSVAFTAAVRTLYILARDPEEKERLLLIPEKTNLSPISMAGLVYHLANVDLGNGISAPRVIWEGLDQRSASEVLAPAGLREGSDREGAKDWLGERLADGPVPVRELQQAAEAELDASWRTVKRAGHELGVVGAGEKRQRTWQLPNTEGNGSTAAGVSFSNESTTREANGPTGQRDECQEADPIGPKLDDRASGQTQQVTHNAGPLAPSNRPTDVPLAPSSHATSDGGDEGRL